MADKEIPTLTAGTAPGGTEVFHGAQGGNSRKFTATQLNAAVGTSFPGSPTTADRFFRTDRNIEYFYDGTRWLSITLFTHEILSVGSPSTGTFSWYSLNPFALDYDIYIEKFKTTTLNSAATPASNYFTIQLQDGDGASTNNLGSSISTQNDAQNAWVSHEATINTVVASTIEAIQITCTRAASGSTYITAGMTYRLVG